MASEKRAEIVKNLIDKDALKEFQDIFLYVKKTDMARQLGINYTRFLNLVKNPKRLRYEETYTLAHILGVQARAISDLIHNQIDKPMKPKR